MTRPREPGDWPHPLVAWYTVILLSLANALSFVARTILSLLVDPVKADLGVSDTAISLLHGFSFALIFAVIGLPIALLADKGNRRNIIALSILVWSVMTALCGLAQSYLLLFLGRLGAGAGEGGFGPASQTILADFFPRERRPLAMGVYSMGIYIGSGAALILGGWVIQWATTTGPIVLPVIGLVKGWQLAFLLVGLPGVALAMLLYLTVPEPPRQGDASEPGASIAEVAAHVREHRLAYTGLMLGFSLHVLVGFGAAAWSPAFLARHFGLDPFQIGVRYGAIFLVCGLIGAFAFGMIGNRLITRGLRNANAWLAFIGYGVEVMFGIGYAWATTPMLAYICIAGMNLFSAGAMGAGFATLNEIPPNRMRAQIGALFLFAINLIGTGLGPTVVALFGDRLFSGTAALAQAISLTSAVFGLPAIALLWLTVRYYPKPA